MCYNEKYQSEREREIERYKGREGWIEREKEKGREREIK